LNLTDKQILLVVRSKILRQLTERLRALRAAHGLTQEAFAELAGMSYKYYQAVEGGRKQELRLSTLQRLAAPYHIEVWQLLAPEFPDTKIVSRRNKKRPSPI